MTLRNELIQVAAVAIATVTDLDVGSTIIVDSNGTRRHSHKTVMADVEMERFNQERKWGERRSVPIAEWLVILGEEYGEACKAALEEVMYPVDAAYGEDNG